MRTRCLLLLLVLLSGCGGGGGRGTQSSGSLGIYLTDNLRQDYDHVWATIYRVTLIDSFGSSRTLFDDRFGRIVDLRTLHDATGSRFAALGMFRAADVTYTSVRVSMGPSMALVPAGSSAAADTPVNLAGAGVVDVIFGLASPRRLARGGDNLVIDFDLSSFQLVGGKIVPFLKEGDRTTLGDATRHERELYTGTLSNTVTSGGIANFTLTSPDGSVMSGATHATTAIWHVSSSGTPVLLNGRQVNVLGLVTGGKLRVDDIRIDPGGDNSPQFLGVPSNIDTLAGTFTVTVRNAQGFVPTATTVKVSIDNFTQLRSENGGFPFRSTFFSLLSGASFVFVQGDYDPTTSSLRATRAKIIGTGSDASPPPQAEATGIAVNANASKKTFTIQPVTQWQGFFLQGNAVDVAPIASAVYKDIDGSALAATTFFNRIAGSAQKKVRAQGAFKSGARGTIQADEVDLLP